MNIFLLRIGFTLIVIGHLCPAYIMRANLMMCSSRIITVSWLDSRLRPFLLNRIAPWTLFTSFWSINAVFDISWMKSLVIKINSVYLINHFLQMSWVFEFQGLLQPNFIRIHERLVVIFEFFRRVLTSIRSNRRGFLLEMRRFVVWKVLLWSGSVMQLFWVRRNLFEKVLGYWFSWIRWMMRDLNRFRASGVQMFYLKKDLFLIWRSLYLRTLQLIAFSN